MPNHDRSAALLESKLVQCALCLGIILIGLFNALPHLPEAIWQDEAATLTFHTLGGMLRPFQHYGTPNNHVAFSSMLAGWKAIVPDPADVLSLRLLPLGLFLAAIPATFFAARRLGGVACASLAALLFAYSAAAGNFATQLRGYGPSWLFMTLALLCAMNMHAERGRWAWRLGYVMATLVGVSILPTNVFFAFATALAVAPYLWLDPARRPPDELVAIAILVLAPPLCLLLAYSGLWDELMLSSGMVSSPWSRAGLLGNWFQATLADYRWILPLVGAGAVLGLVQVLRQDLRDRQDTGEFLLALGLLLGLAAAVLAMPRAPFPRTLVPYLPVWYCAIAYLVCHGVKLLLRGASRPLFVAALVAFSLPVMAGPPMQPCRSAKGSGGAYDYDLCHQYFRDKYHPGQVIRIWASLGRQEIPIATNFEGYHALRAIGTSARIFEYRYFPTGDGPMPMIVAHDQIELAQMTERLGLGQLAYRQVADTGYFKVYAPSRIR